jgi:hypothetical protein
VSRTRVWTLPAASVASHWRVKLHRAILTQLGQ